MRLDKMIEMKLLQCSDLSSEALIIIIKILVNNLIKLKIIKSGMMLKVYLEDRKLFD
jgi:hypothetical protein